MDTNDGGSAHQPLTFQTTLKGDPGMFVEVPPEILKALGPARRPAVRVVINGVELRTTLSAYAGGSQIGLRREIREAAQVAPGESIQVRIELDREPRTVEPPADLAAALLADPAANAIFEGLSFTNRKEYVGWVLAAKTPSTRQRRVAQVPELLKSGRRTPLGKA